MTESPPRSRLLVHLILLCCMGTGVLISGCKTSHDTARFESFTRNKLEVLARSMRLAVDAHTSATDQIVSTLRAVTTKAAPGSEPQAAYDTLRRMLSTTETRAHTAEQRRKRLSATAAEYFDQWGRELEDYEDKALREESRRALNDLKARLKVVVEQMEDAEDAMQEPLKAIEDQMLFTKHHRASPSLPARPGPAIDPVFHAEDLVNQTNILKLRAEDFLSRIERGR